MLPRPYRLTKEKEINWVYRRGRRLSTPLLTIFYLPTSKTRRPGSSQNQDVSRFGFVVSKSQAKNSVDRNRLKRILRAQVATLLSRLVPGFNVIIQGRANLQKLPSPIIREELSRLFKKASLWQKF